MSHMLYSSPLNMFSFMITNLFCCSFRHPSPSFSLSGDEFNCLCLLPKETSLFIASFYLQNLCVYYSLSHSFHDDEQEWNLLLQTAQDSFLEVFGEGKQEESSKKKIRGRKTFGFWVLFTIFSLSFPVARKAVAHQKQQQKERDKLCSRLVLSAAGVISFLRQLKQ